MFDRIKNSWELVKASAAVLRADKELIIFPLVSAIVMIFVSITFFVPAIFAGFFDEVFVGGNKILGTVVGFLFYLVQYLVIFFFNSALIGAALIRLRGGDPTVGDGFRIAWKHLGSILGYAFIAATVGMILRWISERAGPLGQIVIGIIGLAWDIATYLVVPVLVVEDVGPVDAIKRSGGLLRQTWGEQIVGSVGISLIFGLIFLVVILAGVPLIVLAISAESVALVIAAVAVLVLVIIFLALISSALSGIYTAAVYQYAMTGKTCGFFRQDLVESTFRQK